LVGAAAGAAAAGAAGAAVGAGAAPPQAARATPAIPRPRPARKLRRVGFDRAIVKTTILLYVMDLIHAANP